MHLADFDFHLPEELIAQHPVEPRDHARLLVYRRANGSLEDRHVYDLPDLLLAHTHLVANNSRVRKARVKAKLESISKDSRDIEVLFLEPLPPHTYRCLIGGHGVKMGDSISFANFRAQVSEFEPGPGMNTYKLQFNENLTELEAYLENEGEVPLPPYITERSAPAERYQTVFARELGSAAAPTAGLHITSQLIEKLQSSGHSWQEITLHVGLGTFLPLREQEIEKNRLHQEATFISPAVAAQLNQAHENKQSILAIGTTATRTLESHSQAGHIQAGHLETSMFIYPGYRFQTVSALLTNFHLPKSSLLLLVAAFLGNTAELGEVGKSEKEMVKILHRLYAHAIEERYRFFSFGDAMLIL